ncbi:MAG: hypothetical protein GQ540_10415 [Lutibacter sp.]|uniref:DUF6588 family protein n=1 Tax=Lutibacter sp. TaxID=1925666 RepID=UPI001A05B0F9|nr:DUF6588 family protein [Lutibacter sp.]NOR28925.1 hypothetical protein [Lutibacter sp.]
MKKTILLLTLLLSFSAKSQNLESLLLANNDANLLLENYMSPVMEGMLFSLNNGWYHTAKTHKKLGFDITITANAAIVPNSKKTFQFNESDYQYLTLESGDSNIQTVMGSNNNSKIAVRIPEANNNKITEFTMPDGIGSDVPLNAVPSPMIQASVGLPFSTNISIRYLPKINTDDVKGNLIGFGIKHNLIQYLGPLDKLPLNVAVFGGFTTMTTTYNINEINAQEVDFKLNAFTIQTIASLDFPFITIYGGIGYDKGTSTLKLKGTYNLEYEIKDSNDNVIETISESVTNPINMDFNANGARGTLGVRFSLGFFKIYGDYTFKDYNTISTGIAFSFR